MKALIKGILAGILIGIGGTIYLSLDNHIMGAFLFTTGLFTIYTFGFDLFTGKICLIPNKELKFLITVAIVYVGNFIGTFTMGMLIRYTKQAKLIDYTRTMVEGKLNDTLFSSFVMAIFCGILMCVAVIGYTIATEGVGRYLSLIFPIMVFILSGYEHSIADMFYISFANMWSGKAFLFLLVVSVGNLIGGMIFPFFVRVLDGKKLGV